MNPFICCLFCPFRLIFLFVSNSWSVQKRDGYIPIWSVFYTVISSHSFSVILFSKVLLFVFVCAMIFCVCLYWNASNEKFKLKCVATLLGANRNLDILVIRNKFSILFELHDPNNTWTRIYTATKNRRPNKPHRKYHDTKRWNKEKEKRRVEKKQKNNADRYFPSLHRLFSVALKIKHKIVTKR